MALGLITSLVAYGVGAEITSGLISGIGKAALTGSKYLLSKTLPAFRAARTLAKEGHVGATIRQSVRNNRNLESRLSKHHLKGKAMSRLLDRRVRNAGKYFNKVPYNMAKKLGATKSWQRKMVVDTVKTEAKFMPFNYLMYRYEKHEGKIDKKTGFLKYYGGMMGPMSVGFNMGIHASRRGGKIVKRITMAHGGARMMHMGTHLGMELTSVLAKRTRQMGKAYDIFMNKLQHNNTLSTGFFGGALKPLHNLISSPSHIQKSGRKLDIETFQQNLNRMDIHDNMKKELYKSYNKSMGDGTLLKGYNKLLKNVSRYERMASPNKSHLQHVVEHQKKEVQILSSKVESITSRELFTYQGQNYDFGGLHFDHIRDTMNKVLLQDFKIAGKPWLGYLDAGRNILMSKRSRMMGAQADAPTSPANMGMMGSKRIHIGKPDNEDLFESKIQANDIEGLRDLANRTLGSWIGGGQENINKATRVHKASIADATQWLKDAGRFETKYKGSADIIEQTYLLNFMANAKRGVYEIGSNQRVDLLSGNVKVLTNNGYGVDDMLFHANGAALEASYVTNGSTKAGQIVAMLSGKEADYTVGDIHVRGGVSHKRNMTYGDRLENNYVSKPTTIMGKIGDALEWNRGYEQSFLGSIMTISGKFKNKLNMHYWSERISQGKTTENQIKHFLQNNDIERTNLTVSAGKMSNRILSDAFEDFHRLGSLSDSAGETGYKSYSHLMNDMWTKLDYISGKSNNTIGEFVIERGSTTNEALEKIAGIKTFLRDNEHLFEINGVKTDFNDAAIDSLNSTLSKPGNKLATLAVNGTFQGKFDAIDRYHRSMYDFMLDLSANSNMSGVNNNINGISEFVASVVSSSREVMGKGTLPSTINSNDIRAAAYARFGTKRFKNVDTDIGEIDLNNMTNSFMSLADTQKSSYSNMREIMRMNSEKKGLLEPDSAENTLVIISKGGRFSTGGVKRRSIVDIGNDEIIEVANEQISRSSLEMMAAVGTMNSALSYIGLGFDVSSTVGLNDIMMKTATKRIAPFLGLMAANEIVKGVAGITPGLDQTSLTGGAGELALDAYAGTRVVAQYVSDFTGVTSVASYLEDLLPGSINSPLSSVIRGLGPVAAGLKIGNVTRLGTAKGGLVGGAVGLLLGGGPMSLFDTWDISQGRANVIDELSGKQNVAIGSGRFWEMSGDYFLGGKIGYYRPHMYSLLKNDYKNSSNYLGDSMLDSVMGYVDPSTYARQHYYSRPYPQSGTIGSNIPFFSERAGIIPGVENLITANMHEDYMEELRNSKALSGGTGAGSSYFVDGQYGGGMSGGDHGMDAVSQFSLESSIGYTTQHTLDIAGLRGFMVASVLDSSIGAQNMLSGTKIIANANKIGSMSRQYWDMNLGGIVGACFVKGSPIKTINGNTSIENIQINNLVFSNGQYRKVTNIWKYKFVNQIILDIQCENNIELQCTNNHVFPFIRRHKYNNGRLKPFNNKNYTKYETNALHLQTGDLLMYPIDQVEKAHTIDLNNYEIKDVVTKESILLYQRNNIRNYPKYIEINKYIAYLIGWYITKGNTNIGRICFTLDKNEMHYALRIQRISKCYFNSNTIIEEISESNKISIIIYNSILSKYFMLFGNSSHVRHIPIQYKRLPKLQMVFLLRGLLDGGGWRNNKSRKAGFISSSRTLIRDVSELLMKIKKVHNIVLDHKEINNSSLLQDINQKQHISYNLEYSFRRKSSNQYIIYSQDGYCLIPIVSINNYIYNDEYIYDLEIENIHYYTVNGIMVHNSEGIRRIIPRERSDVEFYDPIPNVMPLYMPGQGNFKDFLIGDPFTLIEMGEVRLPGNAYEVSHDVAYTYPIDAITLGDTMEDQVAYYAGDVMYMTQFRRNWNVVERTRKQVIGRMKQFMDVIREKQVAYDAKSNSASYVDAIIDDPEQGQMALSVVPIVETQNGSVIDPGGVNQLNAYLVNNKKDIHTGIVIAMDKDGNMTKQLIHADFEKYRQQIAQSAQAIELAKKVTGEIEAEGHAVSRGVSYSHVNRLAILVDVAPFARETQLELKIVKEQMKRNLLGPRSKELYSSIMKEFVSRMDGLNNSEYRFIPYMMEKTPIGSQAKKRMEEMEGKYSTVESVIGATHEYITHLRNPIFNKLLSKESSYEAYRRDMAIGRGFKSWQSPIEDFIGTNLSMVASDTDPIQATISGATGGAIFGGPIGSLVGGGAAGLSALFGISSNTRASRWENIDRMAAAADMLRYKELVQMNADMTSTQPTLRHRAERTAHGAYIGAQSAGYMNVLGASNKAERKYIKSIMNNLYAEDIDKTAALMAPEVGTLFRSYATNSTIDRSQHMRTVNRYKKDIQGMPLDFRTDDVVYQTMQNEGYNAHDMSLGWFRQANRIKRLNNGGSEINVLPGYSTTNYMPNFNTDYIRSQF